MQQANFARAAVNLRPVGQACECGARCPNKSNRDRDVSAGTELFAAADGFHRVQCKCRRPRAERHVGERGMKRMTEPRTVKKVFYFPSRRPSRFERVANNWLYLLAQTLECFLLFDCLDQCFTCHVPSHCYEHNSP